MRFKCLGEGYNFLKLHNGSVFVLFFGEGKKKGGEQEARSGKDRSKYTFQRLKTQISVYSFP